MIDTLSTIIDSFPGATNQTCCFAHTISISAKSILKQFEVPSAKLGVILDSATQALADLAKELNLEEHTEQDTWETDNNEPDDQPLDFWVDLHEGLMEEEVDMLNKSTQPAQSMLIKVHLLLTDLCTDNNMAHSCISLLLLSRTL